MHVVVQPEWECVWERDHGMNWDDNWAEERFGCGYEDLCPDPATGIAAFVYDGDGSRTERHLVGRRRRAADERGEEIDPAAQ